MYRNMYMGYDNSEVVAFFKFFMEQLVKPKCRFYLHDVLSWLWMNSIYLKNNNKNNYGHNDNNVLIESKHVNLDKNNKPLCLHVFILTFRPWSGKNSAIDRVHRCHNNSNNNNNNTNNNNFHTILQSDGRVSCSMTSTLQCMINYGFGYAASRIASLLNW